MFDEGFIEEVIKPAIIVLLIVGAVFAIIIGFAYLWPMIAGTPDPAGMAQAQSLPILVTDNQTEIDELFIEKQGWYCGTPEGESGSWNPEEYTERCARLMEGDIRRQTVN